MTPILRRAGLAGAFLAASASAALATGATAAESPVLARANARWREAACTLRVNLELKKGKNREGWSRTPLYSVGLMHTQTPTGIVIERATPKGEKAFYFTMEVSDRDALAAVLGNRVIPSGTQFVAEGWSLARPADQKGPYLQLRFSSLPHVKARFWFAQHGGFGTGDSFPFKHFEPVERYLRIEAFALAAADEQLSPATGSPAGPAAGSGIAAGSVARPGGAGAGAGATGGGPAARAAGGASAPYKPALHVVAVACQPARVLAGEEVELVLTYGVESIPPGAAFEVAERREILSGETVIATFDKPMSRLADTYTSVQRVRIPAGAASGLYTVRGTVSMAGISATGTALLEVRAPAAR